MTLYETALTLANLIALGVLFYEMTQFEEHFIKPERIGLGLLSGGLVLTLPVRFASDTPFQSWSQAVFMLGFIIYFVGRGYRNWFHRRNNRRQLLLAAEVRERRKRP